MKSAGRILILIAFILESILIIPLIWTIPGFILSSKMAKGTATRTNEITLAILGIIFAPWVLGIVGGLLIILDNGQFNTNSTSSNTYTTATPSSPVPNPEVTMK